MKNTQEPSQLKERLLQEGITYINRYGLQHFSMRKLAAQCHVSHMAPYKHFANKEAFLKAISYYIDKEFATYLSAVSSALSPQQQLILLGKRYVSFMSKHPDIMFYMLTQGFRMYDNSTSSAYHIFERTALAFLKEQNIPISQQKEEVLYFWTYAAGLSSMCIAAILDDPDRQCEALLKKELTIRIQWYQTQFSAK